MQGTEGRLRARNGRYFWNRDNMAESGFRGRLIVYEVNMIFIKMLHIHIDEGYFVENTHKR